MGRALRFVQTEVAEDAGKYPVRRNTIRKATTLHAGCTMTARRGLQHFGCNGFSFRTAFTGNNPAYVVT